jgi:RimJ/RimL family protein N-acetyltransferase
MSERTSQTTIREIETQEGKITIRHLKRGDVDALCTFVNDLSQEDTYVMLSGEKISKESEQLYIDQSLALVELGKKVHLVLEQKGMIVGNAEIRPNEKRKSHVGTVTIAIAESVRGQGIGTQLLQQLIEEAKNIDLKLLTLSSMHINKAGIAVYEKLGFQKAGVMPQAFLYKGNYVDEVFYYLPL